MCKVVQLVIFTHNLFNVLPGVYCDPHFMDEELRLVPLEAILKSELQSGILNLNILLSLH